MSERGQPTTSSYSFFLTSLGRLHGLLTWLYASCRSHPYTSKEHSQEEMKEHKDQWERRAFHLVLHQHSLPLQQAETPRTCCTSWRRGWCCPRQTEGRWCTAGPPRCPCLPCPPSPTRKGTIPITNTSAFFQRLFSWLGTVAVTVAGTVVVASHFNVSLYAWR